MFETVFNVVIVVSNGRIFISHHSPLSLAGQVNLSLASHFSFSNSMHSSRCLDFIVESRSLLKSNILSLLKCWARYSWPVYFLNSAIASFHWNLLNALPSFSVFTHCYYCWHLLLCLWNWYQMSCYFRYSYDKIKCRKVKWLNK